MANLEILANPIQPPFFWITSKRICKPIMHVHPNLQFFLEIVVLIYAQVFFNIRKILAHSFIDHVFDSSPKPFSPPNTNPFIIWEQFSNCIRKLLFTTVPSLLTRVTVKRSNQEATMRLHIAYLIWFFRYTMLWQVKCMTWYLNLLQNTYMKQHLNQNVWMCNNFFCLPFLWVYSIYL